MPWRNRFFQQDPENNIFPVEDLNGHLKITKLLNFWNWTKIFNCSYIILCQSLCSIAFSVCEKKIRSFNEVFFGKVVKTAVHLCRGTFYSKRKLIKFWQIFHGFWTSNAIFFLSSDGKIWTGSQKCNLCVQKKILKITFWEKSICFSITSGFYPNFSELWRKVLVRFVIASLVLKGTIRRKMYFDFGAVWKIVFLLLWTSCKKLWDFWQKISGRAVKTSFLVSMEKIWGNWNFFGKFIVDNSFGGLSFWGKKLRGGFYFFLFFLDWERKSFGFWLKHFGRFVKTAIQVTRGNFEEKSVFLKRKYNKLFKNFGCRAELLRLFDEIFRKGCQNCIASVQRIILKRNFFLE